MTTEWTVISAHPYLTAMSRPGDSGSLIVERERLPQEPTASGDNRSAGEDTSRLRVVGLLFGGGLRHQPPHGATYPPRAMAGMEVSFVTPARTVLEWIHADCGMEVDFNIGS
jgi:hypothetical protein